MTNQTATAPARKKLRSVQPGEFVVRIEKRRLRGPRGGKYVSREVPIGAPLVRQELSKNGAVRIFYFQDRDAVKVGDRLSRILVAEIGS